MKISFIGGGNMARALIGGLIAQGRAPDDISVIELDADKRRQLHAEYGIAASDQIPGTASADIVVLAVKPQQLRDIAIFLGSVLRKQLVISVAAGIRSSDLIRWLGGYDAVIRVMPNTPAQIRSGVSALFAASGVSADQRTQAETIFSAVGSTIWLDDETQMDAVTAVSGSGPAYVFYFVEAMQQAARELGLSDAQARELSLQTFLGASQLALQSTELPETLRAQVTSKGGTTERALLSMENSGVKAAIIQALRAAAERSRELGDLLGKD
ncbi:MAG: pyrroline-5-carboxylate reductase [Methylobacillus sp.]|jgi:pyrroline-5-carboxylate reductase|nr:pyrroline-5-carboxylate reductase [Methylobacillus sp.]